MLHIASDPDAWAGRRFRWLFRVWDAGLACFDGDLVQMLFRARLPGGAVAVPGAAVFAGAAVRKRFTLRSVSTHGSTGRRR